MSDTAPTTPGDGNYTPMRELLDTVRQCGMCPIDEACEAPDEKAAAGDKDCAMCVRGWDALNELEARLA